MEYIYIGLSVVIGILFLSVMVLKIQNNILIKKVQNNETYGEMANQLKEVKIPKIWNRIFIIGVILFIIYSCVGVITAILYAILLIIMIFSLPSSTIKESMFYDLVSYVGGNYLENIGIIPCMICVLAFLFLIKELSIDINMNKILKEKRS